MVRVSSPPRPQKALRFIMVALACAVVSTVGTIAFAAATFEKHKDSNMKITDDVLGKMFPHHAAAHHNNHKGTSSTSARSSGNPHVTIATLKGPIVVELFPEDAPLTVANFIKLCNNNVFSNSSFYRYVSGFVLQGGLYPSSSPSTVPLEYKLPNDMWSVGLARDNDPHSGSSEYYINLADNSQGLAPHGTSLGYAVFGKVVSGFDAVRAIEKFPTQQSGGTTMFIPPFPTVYNISVV